MTESTPDRNQPVVYNSKLLERIVRFYIVDRLITDDEYKGKFILNANFLMTTIGGGMLLYPKEWKMCLQTLASFRLRLPTILSEPKYHFEKFKPQRLKNLLPIIFKDGRISWQKIIVLLEIVTRSIAVDVTQVTLIDELCHYFKALHFSRDWLTVEEWMILGCGLDKSMLPEEQEISSLQSTTVGSKETAKIEHAVNQELIHYLETLQMPRPPMAPGERCPVPMVRELSQMVSENRPPAIRENRCPCGLLKPLEWDIMPTCDACNMNLCLVPHCSYTAFYDLPVRHHYVSCHYKNKFLALFALHQILYCECGERRVRPRSEKFIKCERCSLWLCCAGSCTKSVKSVGGMRRHLANSCNYKQTGNRDQCSQCRHPKTRGSQAYSNCPRCSTPRTFWCLLGNCEYEIGTAESVKFHQIMFHPEFLWM